MDGLMMDYQLTLTTILRRAETFYATNRVVTRLPDRSFHTYTYADMTRRAKQLAVGLSRLGLQRGDRVATLCWNHYQHLEAYFGIPCGGCVLHTLNLRLHPSDLAYIARHGGDQVVIVDRSLVPLLDKFRAETDIEHVLVVEDTYEELLAGADADDWQDPQLDEREAAAMCFTSGTTGKPKGVVYSHRSSVLHVLGLASSAPFGIPVCQTDAILPVVPMFHANAWGYPYLSTMIGASLVMPGPYLDPESLLDDITSHGVTRAVGVPTVWLGVLRALDAEPDRWDLSRLRALMGGGSAVPRSLIEALRDRHGVTVFQGWGMTETSPVAAVTDLASDLAESEPDAQLEYTAMAGLPLPFVEVRVRDGDRQVAWDGETMGELEVRGPWVASGYFQDQAQADRWTADGWFRTGDIVSMHPRGFIQIKDRTKDVIKSGGEWISSVELENALMAHPAVAEAAVVAIPDPRWLERPLAVVVRNEGHDVTAAELHEHLAPHFAKWWLPDRYEFLDEIPKTSVGKFKKTALRDRFTTETPSPSP